MPPRVGSDRERKPHFIKEWRRYRKLSGQKLADMLNTSKGNISRIENNEQGYTQAFLEACAEALDTDTGSLLTRDPRKQDEDEPILKLWSGARPAQRITIIEVAQSILKISN